MCAVRHNNNDDDEGMQLYVVKISTRAVRIQLIVC